MDTCTRRPRGFIYDAIGLVWDSVDINLHLAIASCSNVCLVEQFDPANLLQGISRRRLVPRMDGGLTGDLSGCANERMIIVE